MMKFSTFARLNGLAVIISAYNDAFAYVRYCGHAGKAIRRDYFWVNLNQLGEF